MPKDEPPRSQAARAAAELALVRVVHHYGKRPEFVLLGGLVPALLCSDSGTHHAGTTDVDVQVNLEISNGAVNAARLEEALRNAEFTPDAENIWRWKSATEPRTIVKFELLADLNTQPAEAVFAFDGCKNLGAVNLRGTGFAARDVEVALLLPWTMACAAKPRSTSQGLPASSWLKPQQLAAGANRRIGTILRSYCYIMTTAASLRQQYTFSRLSAMKSAHYQAPSQILKRILTALTLRELQHM